MKKMLRVLVLVALLAGCDGKEVTHKEQAQIHFKDGFVATCDYVTYDASFVSCHFGEFVETSYPASEVSYVRSVTK